MGPKILIVHRHELWSQFLEAQTAPFDKAKEPDAEQRREYAACEEAPDPKNRVVQQPDVASEQKDKTEQPNTQKESNDRNAVVPKLLGDPLLARLTFDFADGKLVSIHHARDFEGRRTKQPDILADGTIDRHHDLGSKKAVGAGFASGWVVDSIAQVVAIADLDLGELKRRTRYDRIAHRQTVGDHRPAADAAQKRIVVALSAPKV